MPGKLGPLSTANLQLDSLNSPSRHNVGNVELEKGNVARAKKHWMIGSRAGFDASLKHIRMGYEKGWATKDEYADALRAHKDPKDEMKDSHRENARKTGRTWKEDVTGML